MPPRKTSDRFQAGLARRRKVLGGAYVDRARGGLTDFNRDLDKLLNEYVWNDTWGRPGLPLKTRSMLTLALLTALNKQDELRIHLTGALNNGCSLEEIREVLLHTAVYAGVPATLSAFRTVREALADAAPAAPPKRPAKASRTRR